MDDERKVDMEQDKIAFCGGGCNVKRSRKPERGLRLGGVLRFESTRMSGKIAKEQT